MKNNKINFIKINIFPDGGISRFKIFGKTLMEIIIKPKPITKENFSKFGDMITTNDIKPLEINEWLCQKI